MFLLVQLSIPASFSHQNVASVTRCRDRAALYTFISSLLSGMPSLTFFFLQCPKSMCTDLLWTVQYNCYFKYFVLVQHCWQKDCFLTNYTREMPIGIVHTYVQSLSAIEFIQLDVVTSQFVMFIPCALHVWIKDGTGSRHVNQT